MDGFVAQVALSVLVGVMSAAWVASFGGGR